MCVQPPPGVLRARCAKSGGLAGRYHRPHIRACGTADHVRVNRAVCVWGPISGCVQISSGVQSRFPLVQAAEEFLELGYGVCVAVGSPPALDWPALALALATAALALATTRGWPEQ